MLVSQLQMDTIILIENLFEKHSNKNKIEQKENIINDLYNNGYMFKVEGRKTSELLLYKNEKYSFVDIINYKNKPLKYQYVNLS